jgi:hypothetical protein
VDSESTANNAIGFFMARSKCFFSDDFRGRLSNCELVRGAGGPWLDASAPIRYRRLSFAQHPYLGSVAGRSAEAN